MSLDVYLTQKDSEQFDEPRILVRENGQTKEISREEWNQRHPGREPAMMVRVGPDGVVFSANITHNLVLMAKEAGVYGELWRPEELDICLARQLVEPLRNGLNRLLGEPERFKSFNPENGWGDYEGLTHFVAGYLEACKQWPDAKVSVSR